MSASIVSFMLGFMFGGMFGMLVTAVIILDNDDDKA